VNEIAPRKNFERAILALGALALILFWVWVGVELYRWLH
jgi:hypothetical protein